MSKAKICNICGESKPLTKFYKVRTDKEWRKRTCNKCVQQRRIDVANGSLKNHIPNKIVVRNKIVIPKDIDAYKKEELEKWKKSLNL